MNGIRIVYNRLPELATRFPVEIAQIVQETAQGVEADAKLRMAQPKSGLFYRKSKSGKMHQASASGEAPAIDTGALVNSIANRMQSLTTAIVYTNQEYAPMLEFGTRKMGKRPFFRPAAEKMRARFLEKLKTLERRIR